jgi:ABC-2 type transport system permease protein
MSVTPATRRGAWASGPRAFLREALAIAEVEVRKLLRDPTELGTRAVQPALWLVVFGQVFARVRGIDTGPVGYLAFLAPGILAQSVLFVAIFYGISVIWERDLGIVHKLLVSPAHRGALVLGKALSAGVRALSQAAIVYALALIMRVGVRLDAAAIAGVLAAVMLGAAVFSTLSLIVACIVKTRERFMGIGQVLTMPLFFASNAIYPLSLMPGWLQAVARANPVTYLVDALRCLMIAGAESRFSLAIDFGCEAAVFLVLLAIAARLYPSLVR